MYQNKTERVGALNTRERQVLVWGAIALLAIIGVSIVGILMREYQQAGTIVAVENYEENGLPENIRIALETQLRRVLNIGQDIPETGRIGGVIREGTYEEYFNDDIYSASFILDIDEYKQTFLVSMSWSDVVEITNGIIISCPDESLMKYAGVYCKGMYNDSDDVEAIAANPIYNDLPIVVNEFDFAMRKSISYEIRGRIDALRVILVIKDYSGGNYENALQKIRDLGYNPDEYQIEYYDEAGDF